jgi:ABC-type lipoprotein release transport system permease subunit
MFHGPKLAVLAWRNLWSNRRRTIITVFGIAFGVMLAVLATGLGDATYSRMIDYAARMGSGHVTVQHTEYLALPSIKKTVTNVDKLVARAEAMPEVATSVPRISGTVMLATARQSIGAGFLALDPDRESAQTLEIVDDIEEGTFFETSDDKGIILGAKLAENLDVGLGKRVVYTLTDKDGEIVSGLARVSGIVRSGAPSIDASLCLLPIGTVRDVVGYAPDEATQVAVFIHDSIKADVVAQRLGQGLPVDTAALTWKETQAELHAFIEMKVAGNLVLELVILLLIGAGIFNSLFVSVMERLREFGVMIAIGYSAAQVFALVLWESLWIGLIGLAAAALVTAAPYYHLNTSGFDTSALGTEGAEVAGVAMDATLYVDILPASLFAIAIVVLVATVAAGLYPAWKAGRVEPVDAIKTV